MSYAAVKMIHVTSVIISYLLFSLRSIWTIRGSATLKRRWVKILPHVVDTVLLLSAITLAIWIQQDPDYMIPGSAPRSSGCWLILVLAWWHLRFGKTLKTRIIAWIAAQAAFFIL